MQAIATKFFPCLISVLALLAAVPDAATAQRRMWRGDAWSDTRSPLMLGAHYENFNTALSRTQAALEVAFLPNVNSFAPLLTENDARLLNLELGVRFKTETPSDSQTGVATGGSASDLRWRAMLFSLDIYRPLNPLGYSFGITLLDYNRAAAPDLDAKWLDLRLGATTTLGNDALAVVPRLILNCGLNSLQLGSVRYPALADDATRFGFDVGITPVVALRIADKFVLSADYRYQFLFSSERVERSVYGASVWIPVFATLNLFARYEVQEARLNTRSEKFNRAELGFEFFISRKPE